MRLRNIPRARGVLAAHPVVMNEEELHNYKGKWAEEFGNINPIHAEIGMGKGQFLMALAAKNPGINYIGIERYSSVLLRAVEKFDALPESERPANIRFICMDAADLENVFTQGEIRRIYLNFSDPWPKAKHAKRRLTSKEFFARYEKVLLAGDRVEFKTDNHDLFAFSLEEAGALDRWQLTAKTWDLHQDSELNTGNIMTEYEEKFSAMGNPIYKMIVERKA